jgi:sugar phosphate isomerase/epimerase
MAVRWGMIVESLSSIEEASEAGFDCVQPTAKLILSLPDEEVNNRQRQIKDQGIAFEVCPVPLPTDVRVTERGFNLYAWLEHLKKAVRRLSELGCRKLTWSDGRARLLPVEGDQTVAKEQVMQFLYMLCEVAAEWEIVVLVEPLGARRTNFLNTLEEFRSILPLVGKENLSATISLRELSAIGLSTAAFASYDRLIKHVHMENPLSSDRVRVSPRDGDGYEYGPFLRALRGIGYSGVISLPEGADRSALTYCKKIWNE